MFLERRRMQYHCSCQALPKPINANSKLPTHLNRHDGCGGVAKFHLPSHVNSITSTSNPFIKHCVKLRHSSSYRHSRSSALVVGTTPIRLPPVLPSFHSLFFFFLILTLVCFLLYLFTFIITPFHNVKEFDFFFF